MQYNSLRSLQWLFSSLVLCGSGCGFFWTNSASAQQNGSSPIALPRAIPGDSRPVMVIGGIESINQVQHGRGQVNVSTVSIQESPRREDQHREPQSRLELPQPNRERPAPGVDQRSPGPEPGPGPHYGPASQYRSAPQQGPGEGFARPHPGWFVPPAMPLDFDQMMESPMFKKILSLMQENLELKSQMKIQAIQAESRIREKELELQINELRQQLGTSQAELKEAIVSKERLEKRISELEHRSRLLEERARAIGNQASHRIDEDFFKRFAADMRHQFNERLKRSKKEKAKEEKEEDEEDDEDDDDNEDDDDHKRDTDAEE